ncbi:aldo/keto reductase [Shimia aestuarii]|uniref:Predicted oxidoreductase n=1 Tax=Shimia aestuarii TaxID=254406 RepID=A0A1I4HC43_9RHOB|nr:aldo/keto reductase [Shimia aestuarii]SFL39862.1 Predicted oxidoreductase [Shimia aestuarii]
MKTRRLGPQGPEVSVVGVGAMSFGNFYGPTTRENSYAVLDAALEAGVTHLDTANVYGMGGSEETIGEFLKMRGAGTRERFFIATKASITKDGDGKRCYRNDLAHLEEELDKSLHRMGTDHVDLFYVHRRDQAVPVEEVAGTLATLKKKGKIKGIGFSEIAPSSLRRAAAEHPVDAVQSEYSLGVRSPELGLVQTCKALGTALVAFGPVGRSFLTDEPIPASRIPDLPWPRSNPRFQEPNYSNNIKATEPFRALARDMGVPAASLAMAWVLAQGEEVFAIPGTRSVAHFEELVRGAEITLSAEDLVAIETALPAGWAHGDRYSVDQWDGPERYC